MTSYQKNDIDPCYINTFSYTAIKYGESENKLSVIFTGKVRNNFLQAISHPKPLYERIQQPMSKLSSIEVCI